MTISFLPLFETHDEAYGAHKRRFRAHGFPSTWTARVATGAHVRTLSASGFSSDFIAGSGVHRRSLRSLGIATLQTADVAMGSHRRRVMAAGLSYSGVLDGVEIVIEEPAIGNHLRWLEHEGSSFSLLAAEGESHRRLSSSGFSYSPEDYGAGEGVASGVHHRQIRARGLPDDPTAYCVMVMDPFAVTGYGGTWTMLMREVVDFNGSQKNLPIYGLVERFRMRGTPDDTLTGLSRVADRIEFGDVLTVILRELLSEGFVFGGDVSFSYRAVMRVVDGLRMAGLVGTHLQGVSAVAAAIAFGDVLNSGHVMSVDDSVAFNSALTDALRAGALLVEQLLLEAASDSPVAFAVLVEDGFVLGGASTATAQLVELLQEGLSFALHLNLDDGSYIAYSINTESKAATQYSNYPFNSFAKIGDRYYGMTPDGIRELDGPDDAGSPIAARFRMAMSNLGTSNMKRMLAAYLGYTSTGELRIKTITVNERGVKQAHWYRLEAQVADEPREARVKIGQGLRSIYWGFEVEAIDGAAFHIDLLDLQPIVVEQKIQGQGGGKR